jgi:hypothetical protein
LKRRAEEKAVRRFILFGAEKLREEARKKEGEKRAGRDNAETLKPRRIRRPDRAGLGLGRGAAQD